MTPTVRANHALLVSEVFGPTFQGEGPSLGRRAAFVRLGNCNLHCTWCDADYTWAFSDKLPNLGYSQKVFDYKEQVRHMSDEEILNLVQGMDVERVIITGGEPLLQAKRLTSLVERLLEAGMILEFETNGTLKPTQMGYWWGVYQWNVSPKLSNSYNTHEERYHPEVLKWFAGDNRNGIAFKFVCATRQDLNEIDTIVKDCDIDPHTVWIMPEGTTDNAVRMHADLLADEVLKRRWNMTWRLQISVWGDKRGH